jgi:hypothetical protein
VPPLTVRSSVRSKIACSGSHGLRRDMLLRPWAKELPSSTSHSNRSLRTEVSVAGKRNFQRGGKEAETTLEIQRRRRRDKITLGNSANSRLIARFREISVRTRVRGGAERTRTACQARSRYRTSFMCRGKRQTQLAAWSKTSSPATGSETSGSDRQSEIVAAISGPITHLLLLKGEKVQ